MDICYAQAQTGTPATMSRPSAREWGSWEYHVKNAVSSIETLVPWTSLSAEDVAGIKQCEQMFRWRITPYYASLMDRSDPACPIRRQAVPSRLECVPDPDAREDPTGDCKNLKTGRIFHKYPNRIVFLVTNQCFGYCRHCTRKFHTCTPGGTYFGGDADPMFQKDFEYIAAHPGISDVLLSGGDPLTLADAKLEYLLGNVRAIRHVEIIRIGTRAPVSLPQRITPSLCATLQKYHPLWLNTHFNHPKEVTDEAACAVDLLIRHGIIVQNQTVLLRGVNDSVKVMRELNRKLLRIRVRPYYLYHCDNAIGVSHFCTGIDEGLKIIEGLIGEETGFAVPQYVFTTEIGKIRLPPQTHRFEGSRFIVNGYGGKTMDATPFFHKRTQYA